MYSDTIFIIIIIISLFCDKLNDSRGVEYVADFKLTASHSFALSVAVCKAGGAGGGEEEADTLFLFVCKWCLNY